MRVLLLTCITTECVGLLLCNVRILSGYCSMAYRTESPTRSEFTHIISTVCDWNQVAYCSHSKARNFCTGMSDWKNKSTILISNIFAFWWCINLSFVTFVAQARFMLSRSHIIKVTSPLCLQWLSFLWYMMSWCHMWSHRCHNCW